MKNLFTLYLILAKNTTLYAQLPSPHRVAGSRNQMRQRSFSHMNMARPEGPHLLFNDRKQVVSEAPGDTTRLATWPALKLDLATVATRPSIWK